MGLFGAGKERRTQLYIRDDGAFQFRKLPIENSFLVEKNAKGEVISAWTMFYKLLKAFNGMGKIGADMVTISFGRDIIFDPFNQLKDAEKPKKGRELNKDFAIAIATATFFRHVHNAKGSLIMDKVIMFAGTVAVLLALGIGLAVIQK